jgi:pimeloyl-ACP methyl ester carboxylesterase
VTRARPSIRKILLLGVLALATVVVVLNWTYGRLPATPRATGQFVQLAGLKVRYLERPGPEPAVLLIHGLPGTAEDFEAVTPLIAGHRTIAIDRPGYSFSTGGYFPFDRQLQAVHEVIEKLHLGHPILVGHSYGGTISLAYAEPARRASSDGAGRAHGSLHAPGCRRRRGAGRGGLDTTLAPSSAAITRAALEIADCDLKASGDSDQVPGGSAV